MAVYAKLPDGNYAAFPDDWDADKIDTTLRRDHPELFEQKDAGPSLLSRAGDGLRKLVSGQGEAPADPALKPLPSRITNPPIIQGRTLAGPQDVAANELDKARVIAGQPDLTLATPTAPGMLDTLGLRQPMTPQAKDSALMEVKAQQLREQDLAARGMDPRQAEAQAEQVGTTYLRERGIGKPVSLPERLGRDVVSGAGAVVKGNADFVAMLKNDPNFARQEREELGLALRELMPADPTAIDEIAAGAGSVVGSLGPGLAVSKVLQTTMKLSPTFARWAGAAQSGTLEAAPQAGQIYQELADSGVPLDEAQTRAMAAFAVDFATAAATDRAGIFNNGGPLRKWAATSAGQGVQEGEQSMSQDVAMGRPVDAGKALRSAGIGVAAGALGGGPLIALDAQTSPEAQAQREAGMNAERFGQAMDNAVDIAARAAFAPRDTGTPLQTAGIDPVRIQGAAATGQPVDPVKYRKNLKPAAQTDLDRQTLEMPAETNYPPQPLIRGKSQRAMDEERAYAAREAERAKAKEADIPAATIQKADQDMQQIALLQDLREKANLPGPMQAAFDKAIGQLIAERAQAVVDARQQPVEPATESPAPVERPAVEPMQQNAPMTLEQFADDTKARDRAYLEQKRAQYEAIARGDLPSDQAALPPLQRMSVAEAQNALSETDARIAALDETYAPSNQRERYEDLRAIGRVPPMEQAAIEQPTPVPTEQEPSRPARGQRSEPAQTESPQTEAPADTTQPRGGVALYSNPLGPMFEAYTEVADKAINLWNDAIGYRWHVLGKLPQQAEYQSLRYKAMAKIEMADSIAKEVYAAFRNAPDAKQVYDYLTTVDASPMKIGDLATRKKAVAVKKLIDKVGQGLVSRGLIPQEAYERFKDQYLPRIYLRHILGEDVVKSLGSGKKPDLGWMKQRKDIPEDVRHMILGEIRDAAFLAGTSLGTTMRDIAIMDFLELVAQNEQWVFGPSVVEWSGRKVSVHWLKTEVERIEAQAAYYSDQERQKALDLAKRMRQAIGEKEKDAGKLTKDYRRVPESRKYGRLSGAYVRKEIYDDLMATSMLTGDVNAIQSLFESGGIGTKITQYFKWAKVAANPPSHLRNIASNMIMVHLSGVPMVRIPDLMVKSISQIVNNGKYYRIAKKHGLVASTFASQELPDIQRDTLDYLARSGDVSPLIHIQNIGAIIAEKFGKVYQGEEMFGKLVKLMYEMESGVSEEQAVAEAQKWLFDYSQVPPMVRWARNAPTGVPFLTFYYKALPRVAEAMVRRPWVFLPYIAIPKIFAAAVAEMYDVDDDDVEKLMKSMPDYMQDKGHALLWPYKDEYGRWRVVDFSYILPWGMFSEMRRNVSDVEFGKLLETSGLLGGPVADIIAAVKTNKDPFTGKPVIDDRDPPGKQVAALLTYMYDMFAPSWLTSKGAVSRIIDAHTGAVNPKTGDMPLGTTDAWWRMLGVNIYPFDPKDSRSRNMRFSGYDIQDVSRRMKEQIRMANTAGRSKEEINEIRKEYMAMIKTMQDERKQYEKDSRVHPNLR